MAVALALIFSGCRELARPNGRAMLTDEQIIEIANQAIQKEEFGTDMMSRIYCDRDNREWEDMLACLARDYPDPDFALRYRKMLRGRCYQAVWYVPDLSKVIAGRLCVFVDKYTGETIGFCGGL